MEEKHIWMFPCFSRPRSTTNLVKTERHDCMICEIKQKTTCMIIVYTADFAALSNTILLSAIFTVDIWCHLYKV